LCKKGNNILDTPCSRESVFAYVALLIAQSHVPTMPTHDLKYPSELFLKILPTHFKPVVDESVGTVFSEAGNAFYESMENVRLLAQLPEFTVRATAMQVMFDTEVVLAAIGKLYPRVVSLEDKKKIAEERERRLNEQPEEVVSTNEDVANAVHMLTQLCSVETGHEHTRKGVEALLVGLLLHTWTAYEAFVTDIWVAAINSNPRKFVNQIANAKSAENAEMQQEKSIPISYLSRFGFDLRNKMGAVLKRKFDFDRLRGIAHAYESTFGKDAKGLFDTSQLNSANMAALEAIRNLFAHRSGKSDLQFRDLIKKCHGSPYHHLQHLEDDKKVEVDGIMVREFFYSASIHALAMLRYVKGKM
jgi:hypothetical protein